MGNIFKIDTREIQTLINWYRKQPRKFRVATGMMLNELAYTTRENIFWLLRRRMIIRSPKFVKRHIRVTNARFSMPISSQMSVVGTTYGNRFSGWVEQEFGRKPANDRTATLLGRGGNKSGKLRPSYRLKPIRDVVSMDGYEYDAKNPGQFIAMIHNRKEKRLIRIETNLYKRRGKKLMRVQNLKNRNKKPKRRPFIKTSARMTYQQNDINKMWGKIIRKVAKPPKK